MAQELRRAAADQKYGVVAGGFRLAKRHISLDEVTGALNVGVPPRVEIVNDSVEAFLFWSPRCTPSILLPQTDVSRRESRRIPRRRQ